MRADATSTPVTAAGDAVDNADSGNEQAASPAAEATCLPDEEPQTDSSITESAAVDLSQLSTQEQLKSVIAPASNLNELALRLRPEVNEIPPTPSAPADHPVGALLDFWVQNIQTNETFQITAKLAHKTDVAYAWVEVDQNFDQVKLVQSINTFSESHYPKAVDFFGSENKPGVDNDPRLHILHTAKTGGGVAGYFSSADTYSLSLIHI